MSYSYLKHWYRVYVSRCKNRGTEFKLDREKFFKMALMKCHYCGAPPQERYCKSNVKSSFGKAHGIDRVDSSKGYLDDNVVTCCTTCNRMKSDLSVEEFLIQVLRIKDHLTQNLHKFKLIDILHVSEKE